MKNFKTFIYLLLTLSLVFGLVACNNESVCTEHKDADNDGKCDICKEEVKLPEPDNNGGDDKEKITLTEGGVANFQIVTASSLPSSVMKKIDSLIEAFEKAGMTVELVSDKADTEKECEILIGNIKSRDDKYKVDMYTLGMTGHIIKAVDKKIIINAGDTAKLAEIFERFTEKHLNLSPKPTKAELSELQLSAELFDEKIQDNYRVSEIIVGDKSIKTSVIAIQGDADSEMRKAAEKMQKFLYERCGIHPEICDINTLSDEEAETAIQILLVENAGKAGFRAKVSGSSLILETEFPNKIVECVEKFLNTKIATAKDEVIFTESLKYSLDIRNIYYNDFGAVGDGVTDDFDAICEAHDYANKYGHTVYAGDSDGKTGYTYYIGKTGPKSAYVKTDVVWGKAKFIIDDSIISPSDAERSYEIFSIRPDHDSYKLTKEEIAAIVNSEGGIDRDVTKLNYAPGYPVMLIVYNSDNYQYIRYGANANSGKPQHELVILDAEGNIDPTTPFLFDYEKVTSIEAYRIDDKPITLSGGIFTTVANRAPRQYTYYQRNINIRRSNVTIKGLEHIITGEGDTGAPYSGFINFNKANNLRVEDTILQGHKTYDEETAPYTHMGTYDISGGEANGMYFYNCIQSNFFTDATETTLSSGLWGIMGTNYCKNITYDKCRLSRLDAHAGVYNATIKNGSEVQSISLIGGGEALIENSTVYTRSNLITLREDYGSLWDGSITVNNVRVYGGSKTDTVKSLNLVSIKYNNHNFGYPITFADRIVINGLEIMNPAADIKISLFSNPTSRAFDITAERVPEISNADLDENGDEKPGVQDKNGLYKNYNPIKLPDELIIVGLNDSEKKNFTVCANSKVAAALKDAVKLMSSDEYEYYSANK